MKEQTEPGSVPPDGQDPNEAERGAQDTAPRPRQLRHRPCAKRDRASDPVVPAESQAIPMPGRRRSVWLSGWLLTAVATGFFWWMGSWLLNKKGPEEYSPPAADAPKSSQTSINNNAIAGRKLVTNLEGTAVLYPQEVRGLTAPGERFVTDLSLRQLADTLKIEPQAIAKKGSTTDIDPEAVLFIAIVGRLSEQAKARSRGIRLSQARDGQPSDYAVSDWVKQEISFTLNALRHPSGEQKPVLQAIWRSASEVIPEPGEKYRATWESRHEIQSRSAIFWPGYLPLEKPPADALAPEE